MPQGDYSPNQLVLLALASVSGIGPATINALVREAHASETLIQDFLSFSAKELSRRLHIPCRHAEQLKHVTSPIETARQTLDLLQKTDIYPVFRDTRRYPNRLSRELGDKAPPVLFIAGDISLLSHPTLAIVGSRQPSDITRQAAYQLALSQAQNNVTIISGGARGIDTTGHQGAIRDGKTVVIPATGVATHRWNGIDRSRLRPGQWCVFGQFPPQDPWRTRNALQRNHTIVALSDAVVGFEPRDEGGTWRSCRAALRMRKPLFVVNGSTEKDRERGQRYFVNRGAIALSPRHMPTPEEFRQLVDNYTTPPEDVQSELFT